MALLNKGRLSVQRVEKEAWIAISKIANEGPGDIDLKPSKKPTGVSRGKSKRATKSRSLKDETHDTNEVEADSDPDVTKREGKGKRNAKEAVGEAMGTRKSKRVKT
jgi:hypothetical protein